MAWMLAFQAGDERAFDRIVEAYKGPVLSVCFRYLRDRVVAEDAAQDVFVKVWGARDRYEPSAGFKSWIFRIASNHCINLSEKERRRRGASLDAPHPETGEAMVTRIEDGGGTPADALEGAERAGKVHEALARLPDSQRMAVILCRFQGCSYEEIGAALDLSIPAVKSLLFRARSKLKELLAPYIEG